MATGDLSQSGPSAVCRCTEVTVGHFAKEVVRALAFALARSPVAPVEAEWEQREGERRQDPLRATVALTASMSALTLASHPFSPQRTDDGGGEDPKQLSNSSLHGEAPTPMAKAPIIRITHLRQATPIHRSTGRQEIVRPMSVAFAHQASLDLAAYGGLPNTSHRDLTVAAPPISTISLYHETRYRFVINEGGLRSRGIVLRAGRRNELPFRGAFYLKNFARGSLRTRDDQSPSDIDLRLGRPSQRGQI